MTKTLEEVLKDVIFCDGHGDKECWFLERENDGKPKKGKNGKTEPFRPSVLKKKHDGRYKDEKGNPVVLIEADVSDRYHVYSKSEKKDFMFIMETPGKKKDNGEFTDYVESGKLKYKDNFDKYVELKQENFLKWILKPSDKDNILDIINQELLDNQITLKLNDDKKPEKETFKFFDHFHVTDVRKCADGNTGNCFKRFLKEEIEILSPKLILCFGRVAWDRIRREYEPELVKPNTEKEEGFSEPGDITQISQVHGYLFKFNIKENSESVSVYIIPCIHFSGTARNSAPRTTYIDYISEGLKKFKGKM